MSSVVYPTFQTVSANAPEGSSSGAVNVEDSSSSGSANFDLASCSSDTVRDSLDPAALLWVSELGRGNGGVVCKLRSKHSGNLLVRKTFDLDMKNVVRAQILKDLQVLSECSSSLLVDYYGVYHSDTSINLCMEYMDAGGLDTLLPLVGRFPEPIIVRIADCVTQGLLYLWRERRLLHRNLKPSNILLSRNGQVKLCDFVFSMQLSEILASAFVGMHTYMAPECLLGEPFTAASDVWSLGLTLMELAIGHYPIPAVDPVDFVRAFAPDRESNMLEHSSAARLGQPLPALDHAGSGSLGVFDLFAHVVEQPAPRLPAYCFSTPFIRLIHSCLQRRPADRLSLGVVRDRLLFESTADEVSLAEYLRGIFAKQQDAALDAVALAVGDLGVECGEE